MSAVRCARTFGAGSRGARTTVASRKRQKWRRTVGEGREPVGGKCEAAECPEDAVAEVFIPDDQRVHKLCEQHALAIEFQMRRNAAAARQRQLDEAAKKLGMTVDYVPARDFR